MDHGNDAANRSSQVLQLRVSGTDHVFALPERGQCLIGSTPECAIRLKAEARLSAHHARLVCDGSVSTIHDLGTDTGTWIDGVRQPRGVLVPGMEIRVGGVTLIAESSVTIEIRGLLAWLVGYGSSQRMEIEGLMRSVREAALGRSVLVLCGRGELSGIAARLHRTVAGTADPFVVVGHDQRIDTALAASRDGTLCLSTGQLASEVDVVRARMGSRRWRTRLVICAPTPHAAAISLQLGTVTMVSIAPLEDRPQELARIIEQCARDAAVELGQVSTGLDRADRAWLRARTYRDLAELDQTVRRVVAIRALGVTHGAARLGLSHGALSRWARRRVLPT